MRNRKLLLLRKIVKLINDRKADSAPKVNGVKTFFDIPYMNDDLQSHKLDIYLPENHAKELPAIIYIHGGGWCLSDKKHFKHYCQMIAANGYAVFNVNYRLAPEYRYPSQLMDILSAMEWVKTNACSYGADPTQIFMFGDSSGAHLASLAVCLITSNQSDEYYKIRVPLTRSDLCGCVLFCGTYDLESCLKTSFPFINDFVCALLGVKYPMLYKDIDQLSVIKNMNSNFPPCFISDSTADALIEESRNLINVLDLNHIKHSDLLLDDVGKASAHEYQIEYDNPVFHFCMKETVDFLKSCVNN